MRVNPRAGPAREAGAAAEEADEDRRRLSARAAAVVFVAYLTVALPVLLSVGSDRWFVGDDWEMLVNRRLSSVGDWFRPANGHWSTLPVVTYQVLFKLFGLRSYLPYQLLVILLHLTLAVLVRVVMRRAGVRPWTATFVAAVFVLFGSGQQNIFFAIQVSQVGSMVLGFTHVILADHDGPLDRRDWLGLLAGAGGLMASGIGPIMVMVVGISTLVRRGWRFALFHTAPLVAMYFAWLFAERHSPGARATRYDIPTMIRWIRIGTTGVFTAIAQYDAIAAVLFGILVVGLVLACLPLDWNEFRHRYATVLALVLGGLALFAVVSTQRYFFGDQAAKTSRYISMSTACLLPALAVAADAVLRRWRLLTPILLLVFLLGLPDNVRLLDVEYLKGNRDKTFVLGVAASPLAAQVSRDVHPDANQLTLSKLTVGWLVDEKRAGKIPDPPRLNRQIRDKITMRLSVAQSVEPVPLPAGARCRSHDTPFNITLARGDELGLDGPITLTKLVAGKPVTGPVSYGLVFGAGRVLTVEVPRLTVRVGPKVARQPFRLCR